MSRSTEPGSRLGVTASEAARHLGVSISTVRRWSDAGHLQGYRTPGGSGASASSSSTRSWTRCARAGFEPRGRDSAPA